MGASHIVSFIFLLSQIPLISQPISEKPNLLAKDYFEGKFIAICEAIDKDDTKLIEDFIKGGGDINKKGKCDMTLLMYSLISAKCSVDTFQFLIKNGADPLIPINTSNRGFEFKYSRREIVVYDGYSARTVATIIGGKYFSAVYEIKNIFKTTDARDLPPFFAVLISNSNEKVELFKFLLKIGADINEEYDGDPIVLEACGRSSEIAWLAIQNGANPLSCNSVGYSPIHRLSRIYDLKKFDTYYTKILNHLVKLGDSIEEAKEDLKRRRDNDLDKEETVKQELSIRKKRIEERSKNLKLITP